jgi:hypothetical protein
VDVIVLDSVLVYPVQSLGWDPELLSRVAFRVLHIVIYCTGVGVVLVIIVATVVFIIAVV